jgi:hypothetical protein
MPSQQFQTPEQQIGVHPSKDSWMIQGAREISLGQDSTLLRTTQEAMEAIFFRLIKM